MNRRFQTVACALIFVAQPGFGALAGTESPEATRGVYFSEKSYEPAPLPRFAEIRDRLPSPLFEERPEWVPMYWKSWELAFKNFHEPAPGSGYVLLNHLATMGEVFQKTGTVWENYAPDALAPGRPGKPDFVGWSGIGPILYLLEFAVGLKPDAASNTLVWEVASAKPLGVERFRFNRHVVSLKAEPAGGDGRSRMGKDAESPDHVGWAVRCPVAWVPGPWTSEATAAAPSRLRPFGPEPVHVLDGPFRLAFERNRRFLASLDPDRQIRAFRLTAGLPTTLEPGDYDLVLGLADPTGAWRPFLLAIESRRSDVVATATTRRRLRIGARSPGRNRHDGPFFPRRRGAVGLGCAPT